MKSRPPSSPISTLVSKRTFRSLRPLRPYRFVRPWRLHCYHIMFLSHFRMPASPAPYREQSAPYQSQAMTRPRYLTLAYEDMETIKTLPPTFAVSIYQLCEITGGFHRPVLGKLITAVMISQEAEALAREWINPPPGATFLLRVPVEYASVQASRLLQGGSSTPEHCWTPRCSCFFRN